MFLASPFFLGVPKVFCTSETCFNFRFPIGVLQLSVAYLLNWSTMNGCWGALRNIRDPLKREKGFLES